MPLREFSGADRLHSMEVASVGREKKLRKL
jgi:hypothetical protein